jgi:hypothetical protein
MDDEHGDLLTVDPGVRAREAIDPPSAAGGPSTHSLRA